MSKIITPFTDDELAEFATSIQTFDTEATTVSIPADQWIRLAATVRERLGLPQEPEQEAKGAILTRVSSAVGRAVMDFGDLYSKEIEDILRAERAVIRQQQLQLLAYEGLAIEVIEVDKRGSVHADRSWALKDLLAPRALAALLKAGNSEPKVLQVSGLDTPEPQPVGTCDTSEEPHLRKEHCVRWTALAPAIEHRLYTVPTRAPGWNRLGPLVHSECQGCKWRSEDYHDSFNAPEHCPNDPDTTGRGPAS